MGGINLVEQDVLKWIWNVEKEYEWGKSSNFCLKDKKLENFQKVDYKES